MTLTEFLLARISEDEHQAGIADLGDEYFTPARVLAECEAKRRIVESYVAEFGHGDWLVDHDVLRLLALPYREKWKP